MTCRVTGFATKKPQPDQADPVRNELTGLWLCPLCRKHDFLSLREVSAQMENVQMISNFVILET